MKQQTQTNKTEWREVELGDVALIDSGQGAPQGEKYFEGKEIFVRAGDLNKLSDCVYVGDYCERITKEAIDTYKLKKYKKNSIVFPKSGMSIKTGNIAILKYDSYVVNHLAIVNPSDKVYNLFLFYFLKKIGISHLSKDESYPSIRITEIQSIKIHIPFSNGKPDLKEQQRIVKILEKAEKQKEKSKNANDLLDEYLKSVFNEMFLKEKFEKVTLNEIGQLSMGGTPSTSIKDYWENGNINWMKSGDIKGDFINFVPNKITQKGFDKSNTTLYPKNTVVIALNGQGKTRGTTAILKIETTSNQSVVGIMINNKRILSEYLHYNLKLRYNELRNLTGDDERSGLNLSILRSLKIPIPPLPLQQKFAKIVEQVEEMKENVKKTKQNSEELFNSLMSKAFIGEL